MELLPVDIPWYGRVSRSKFGFSASLIRSTQGRKWAHPSTWLYQCVTPLSGSGSPGDVALARANRVNWVNHQPLIKRMPLGQHPDIGRVSVMPVPWQLACY